jgi:GST-like protein
VKAWHERVTARPAAQRVLTWKERFAFKTEMDEAAKRALFPQNAHLKAA